jgi:hypothetical protein
LPQGQFDTATGRDGERRHVGTEDLEQVVERDADCINIVLYGLRTIRRR